MVDRSTRCRAGVGPTSGPGASWLGGIGDASTRCVEGVGSLVSGRVNLVCRVGGVGVVWRAGPPLLRITPFAMRTVRYQFAPISICAIRYL